MDPAIPTTSDETLFQIGFVTRDIRASMREFTQRLGVGPWHLRERGVFPVQFYRGEPTGLALAVAMGYAPSSALQYELIQQLDDLPSIYQDVLKRQAHGFHHYGVLTRNYEASVARYKSEGFEAVYEAEVPGGRVVLLRHHRTALRHGRNRAAHGRAGRDVRGLSGVLHRLGRRGPSQVEAAVAVAEVTARQTSTRFEIATKPFLTLTA